MPRTLVAALAGLGLIASTVPALAQDAAKPPTTGLGQSAQNAPTDDYGYVAWCYGALAGYVDLYDDAMPEVIRIERAFPTPSTEENIKVVYPAQRDDAKKSMVAYRAALTAAEKASPRAINATGAAALNRGRSIWSAAGTVPKAQLGQFWMGWAPPADCDSRAKTLQAKSALFGQALSFNAQPAPDAPTSLPAADAAGAPAPASIDDVLGAPAAPATPETPALRGAQ